MSNTTESLRSLSYEELTKMLHETRKQYFTLKLNANTTHIKDYSQFKKLRRSIARILTRMTELSAQH